MIKFFTPLFLLLFFSHYAAKAQYTQGNLVVLQAQGNTGNSQAVNLVEYTTSGGSAVNTLSLPTTGTNRISISGSATTEGQIALSAERDRLIVVGYDTVTGIASISGTSAATYKRAIYTVTQSRTFTKQYTTNSFFSSNSIRGGTAFGSSFLACGGTSGTVVMSAGTQASTSATNQRSVQAYNGNIYSSTSAGIFVMPGMSTASSQTATNLIGSAIDCNGFSISPDGLTLYIASGTTATGIAKYTRTGSTGLNAFTFQYAVCSTTACTGIAVDYTTTNPTIYAVKASSTTDIIKAQDMGSASSSQATLTTLVTGSSSTPFRGIMFAPAVYTATIAGTTTVTAGSSTNITFTGNPFCTITYNLNGGSNQTIALDSGGKATLSTGTLSTAGTYTYNLVNEILPSGTNTMSGSAVVTVTSGVPTITANPSNSTICTGASTTFSGAATGGTITYKWQRSTTGTGGSYADITSASIDGGVTYSGFTTATLTLTTPGTGVGGYAYRLVATNGSGSANSSGATLTVNTTPTVVSITGTTTVCVAATTTLSNATSGGVWSSSNTAIASVSTGGVISGIAAGSATISYTVSASGCSNTATAAVTVNALPNITLSGTTSITSGSTTVLTFSGASGDVVYYWNGTGTVNTTIGGAGTSTVSVSPTVTTTYSVTSATSSASCSQTFSGITATVTVTTGSSSDTIPTRDNNLAMGNPSGATTVTTNYTNYLMTKSQYTLSYNDNRGLANWVSWHLSRAWKGSAARCDCFTQDATLPSGYYRASTGNYTGTGFDRGHLCPSDDRDGSDTDNAATFLMTNITPQAPFLNQQPWNNLENYCRSLIDFSKEMYIISGNYGTGGTGGAGGTTTSIASGNIIVPSNFWKVVLVLPVGINDVSRVSSSTRVFAINMPNVQSVSTDAWEAYKISVDSLETLTGYDFLSNVSTTIQNAIESNAEVTLAAWDFRNISSPTSQVVTAIHPKMDTTTASNLNTLTRGSGASASTATNSFRTTGFGSDGISTSNSDYFQFKIRVASGYTASISGVDMNFGGTSSYYASPGVTSQLAYSFDGSSFTLIGSPIQSTSVSTINVDFSGVSALQNLSSSTTVYFRYYASGQTSGGAWGFNSADTGIYGLSVYGKIGNGSCSGTPSAGTASASPTSVCSGGSSTLSLSGHSTGTGYTYQWQSSPTGSSYSNISGATNATYNATSITSSTYYRCVTTCTTSSLTATSSAATVSVTAPVTPALTISNSPTGSVCAGTSVTYSTTPTNGGSSPAYQWKKNNVSITGATNATYNYAPANSDSITCVLTSNASCASPTTATSNLLVASVTATVTPSLSIAASPSGAVCAGTTVSYTATPTNGGATPAYQWYKGTVAISGATNATYSYTPANSDTIFCKLTSSAACPSPTFVNSNSIVMTVNPTTPTVGAITGTLSTTAGGTTTLNSSTSGGTWTSANTGIATINSGSGVATGVAVGTVIITYTITTSCGSNYDTALLNVGVPVAVTLSDTAWAGMTGASAAGASLFANLPAATTPGTSYITVSQWNRNVVTAGSGTGFYNTDNWSTGTSLATAQSEGKYIYFTITNSSNTEVKLTKVNIIGQRSSTGPPNAQMQYRIAGGSTDQSFGSATTVPTSSGNIAFTGSLCIPPGQTDTFKVYGWGATTSGGTCRVTNGSYIYAVYVTGISALSLSSSTNSSPVCAGTALSLTGGNASNGYSPYTYSWAGVASYTSTMQNATVASPTSSGTYTFTVTDNLGCTKTNTTTATVNPLPTLTITPTYTSVCNGLSTSLSASGAVNYSWLPSGSLSASTGAVVTASPTVATTYTLTGTNANGCVNTQTQAITLNGITPGRWRGTVSSVWSDTSNWVCGYLPTVATNVVIPAGTTYSPIIASGYTAYSNNATIDSASALTLSGSAQWQVKGNFSNNTTVAGSGKIILNGTSSQTISGKGRLKQLELNNTAGATIAIAARLTVDSLLTVTSGSVTTNDSLTLNSDSLTTGRIAALPSGSSINGNVTVMQYIMAGRRAYRFWSHPFSHAISLSQLQPYIDITGAGGAANGFVTTGSNTPSAFRYQVATANWSLSYDPGWRPFTSLTSSADTNMFNRYQGVRIFIRGAKGEGLGYAGYAPSAQTVKMKGLVNQGTQVIHLQKGTSAYQDINMVGNPYPSPVNIGTVAFNAKVSGNIAGGAFYVWNPYIGANGQFVAIPVNTTSATPYYLQANTSFQILAAHHNDSLVFNEAHKYIAPTGSLLKTADPYLALSIYDNKNMLWDKLLLQFDNNYDDSDDNNTDAIKIKAPDFNFYSLSSNKHELCIDSRAYSPNMVIPLYIQTNYAQSFTLKVSNVAVLANNVLYLHDKKLNQYILLQEGTEYRFNLEYVTKSKKDNRFELVAQIPGSEAPAFTATLYPNPAKDIVNITIAGSPTAAFSVTLFDLTGKAVLQKQTSGNTAPTTLTLPLQQLSSGTYIVEITTGQHKVVKKMVKW